ncbi:hypothetical protein RND71_010732 [Anisodus tanguticus]|uniref:Uncharacterized protein n=1 Tax=Anisodus tanguticus TaxID=243964 RepID=A0AAE1VJD9_9SOLA|nr:hypothetical protein RND71_010732 [Anisodus tanguticus]
MENRKFVLNQLLKDKKLWFASFLIIWAAGLQGHMMWLQRQDSFKEKFGNLNDEGTNQQELADNK